MEATLFAISDPPFPSISRVLVVRNLFPVPIALYSIEIDDSRFRTNDIPLTSESGFPSGIVAAPGVDWVMFLLPPCFPSVCRCIINALFCIVFCSHKLLWPSEQTNQRYCTPDCIWLPTLPHSTYQSMHTLERFLVAFRWHPTAQTQQTCFGATWLILAKRAEFHHGQIVPQILWILEFPAWEKRATLRSSSLTRTQSRLKYTD